MKRPESRVLPVVMLAAFMAGAPHVTADDKWELGGTSICSDDVVNKCNQLLHGQPQTHDLQGAAGADLDYMFVEVLTGRSYEVRAFNSNQPWTGPTTLPTTTTVDRVADDGTTVLTAGFAPDPPFMSGVAGWNAVRWTQVGIGRTNIRVRSNQLNASNANDQYEIEFLETTYFVPRWNASGTQATVILIQSTGFTPVTGNINFYLPNSGGSPLHTVPLTLGFNHLQVVNTASIPQLAGFSGHLQIAHDGGWGALMVKAVALEPSTGFSFDTIGAQRPR